jgi:hypothetical protein
MKSRVSALLAGAFALLAAVNAADAQEPVVLTATLSGKTVVPDGGDPDGAGSATVTVDPAKRQLCYEVTVSEIDPPTMAHIHRGAAGAGGPPVVALSAPKDGIAKGCSPELDAATLRAIIANPAAYYVNVHTSSYRAGALRGQLTQ